MNYVDNFKLYLKTDKNASVHTIENYERDINGFLNYHKTPKDLTAIKPAHIRSYVSYLDDLGRARRTINRMICALKTFFNYLVEVEELITKSPAASIKCGKIEKSLPKAISQGEASSIISAAESRLKDQVIIELLYGLGGRVSEIVNIKVEDIDFDQEVIRIIGKGKKERRNPIHSGCLELIKLYMKKRKITSGYLFPCKLDKSKPMSRESIYKLVKRIAKNAGVDVASVSPHVFRHSYATHMLENGCDMAVLQEYLGHEDISTTKIYAQVTTQVKRDNYKKFHPLAK
jgi:site-specific recombinase XerD